jgi:hypothetical protein
MLKVIRKRHVVPLSTSVVRFEPAYFAPLLELKYRPGIADPMSKVVVDDIPVESRSPSMLYRTFATVEDEIERIVTEFGSVPDPKNKQVPRNLIPIAFPAGDLRAVILAEVEKTEHEDENQPGEVEILPELRNLAGRVKGLTEGRMRTLTAAGCGALASIAGQNPEVLSALEDISLSLAKRLVVACQAAVPAAFAVNSSLPPISSAPAKPATIRHEMVPLES